ncbi:MarR family winged helix-turn-helix transcriptional regulator [Oligoflexus tunisiensis]|uniref:MarR family winged helix-turn-helix transcriptional regulator n=1 Tax=Oligoflexus tunisiensis TaxID=708132 RepID=UPI00159F3285|nr:MarR family transcriptional regulator [Oligoflexus tunisiensis]
MGHSDGKSGHAGEALNEAQRELGTWTLLFHQAIAERAGLHPTDHKCLDLICRMGPITAGELAQLAGLTTGAVTAVVDRLVERDLVERNYQAADRRKVYLHGQLEKASALFSPLFASLGKQMNALYADYTEAELDLITGFTKRACSILEKEVQNMNSRQRTGVRQV